MIDGVKMAENSFFVIFLSVIAGEWLNSLLNYKTAVAGKLGLIVLLLAVAAPTTVFYTGMVGVIECFFGSLPNVLMANFDNWGCNSL